MGTWSSAFKVVSNRLPNRVVQGLTGCYFKATAWRHVGFRGYHSNQSVVHQGKMKVRILPALSDNYMYLLVDETLGEAAIIDPVEPDTVIAAVEEEGVKLTTILTTHHHWDHAGGNKDLIAKVSGLTVVGGVDSENPGRIDGVTRPVHHGDEFKIGSLHVRCLATPCHTTGHICYFVTHPDHSEEKLVFTGDTLFLGGCGRFFEGTAEQMYAALVTILGALPDETKVYCGHEYSLQNLAFGAHVEPENKVVADKIAWCKSLREKSVPEPTVPSIISEEKMLNPFMRVHEVSVQKHAGQTDPIETMRALRSEKDHFKAS